MAVRRYFRLDRNVRFVGIDQLDLPGKESGRALYVVRAIGGTRSITGYDARHYLDHEVFEANGVAVEYMNYRCTPYPQSHAAFTPHVSILDLMAHCGHEGVSHIHSGTRP